MWNRFVTFKTNGTVPHAVCAFQLAAAKSHADADADTVSMDNSNHSVVAPIWLLSPPPMDAGITNCDALSNQAVCELFQEMQSAAAARSGDVTTPATADTEENNDNLLILSHILDLSHVSHGVCGNGSETSTSTNANANSDHKHPHSLLLQPTFYDNSQHSSHPTIAGTQNDQKEESKLVALLFGIFYWHALFSNMQIPLAATTMSNADDEGMGGGVICQIQNSCGQILSCELATPNNENHDDNQSCFLLMEKTTHHEQHGNPKFLEIPLHVPGNERNQQACRCALSTQSAQNHDLETTTSTSTNTSTNDTTSSGNDKTALYTSLMALLFIVGGTTIWATISATQRRQEEQLTKAKSQIGNNNDLLATLFPSTYYMGMQQWFGASTTGYFGETYDTSNQKIGKEDIRDKKDKQIDGGSTSNEKNKSTGAKPKDGSPAVHGNGGVGEGIDLSHNRNHQVATIEDGEESVSQHSRGPKRQSLGNRGSQHSRVGRNSLASRRSSGGTLTSGNSVARKGSLGRGGEHSNISRIRAKKAQMVESTFASRPIADLFPDATVMHADICGFAAWHVILLHVFRSSHHCCSHHNFFSFPTSRRSSSREPHHIFELLESICHAASCLHPSL